LWDHRPCQDPACCSGTLPGPPCPGPSCGDPAWNPAWTILWDHCLGPLPAKDTAWDHLAYQDHSLQDPHAGTCSWDHLPGLPALGPVLPGPCLPGTLSLGPLCPGFLPAGPCEDSCPCQDPCTQDPALPGALLAQDPAYQDHLTLRPPLGTHSLPGPLPAGTRLPRTCLLGTLPARTLPAKDHAGDHVPGTT
jgi:hypothetical protein